MDLKEAIIKWCDNSKNQESVERFFNETLGIDTKSFRGGFKCKSPFRDDNNPSVQVSWYIDRKDGLEKLSICDWALTNETGKYSDIVNFTHRKLNLEKEVNFGETLRILNKELGANIKMDLNLSLEERESRQEKRKLYSERVEILNLANQYYVDNFKNMQYGKDYMKDRKYDENICINQGIGYAPSKFEVEKGFTKPLFNYLQENLKTKYSESDLKDKMVELGLSKIKDGEFVDTFNSRIMFTFKDRQGNTIGFGGRDITNKHPAKYLNSATIPDFFEKGNTFYNMEKLAKGNDTEKNKLICVLLEGYMDAFAMEQAKQLYRYDENGNVKQGCEKYDYNFLPLSINSATLTDNQVKQLHKVDGVVLALDNDDAGKRGTLEAIKKLINANKNVIIMNFGGYKDFDELYKNEDKKEYAQSEKSFFESIIKNNRRMFAQEWVVKNLSGFGNELTDNFFDFVADINVEKRGIFLKEFFIHNKLSDVEILSASQKLQIPKEHLPMILSGEYNLDKLEPVDIVTNDYEIHIPVLTNAVTNKDFYNFLDVEFSGNILSSNDLRHELYKINDTGITNFITSCIDSSKYNYVVDNINNTFFVESKENPNNTITIEFMDYDYTNINVVKLLDNEFKSVLNVIDYVQKEFNVESTKITMTTDLDVEEEKMISVIDKQLLYDNVEIKVQKIDNTRYLVIEEPQYDTNIEKDVEAQIETNIENEFEYTDEDYARDFGDLYL